MNSIINITYVKIFYYVTYNKFIKVSEISGYKSWE